MNFAKKLLSSVTAVTLAVIFVTACGTVAPKPAKSSQASFDQGGQNSGILASAAPDGFWVTSHLVDRYNALIAIYGGKFAPPLTPYQGIYRTPTNTFIMGNMAMEHFISMNRWHKQDAPLWVKP